MTQEEKQLLVQDLSARLPYNVQVDITYSGEHGSSDRIKVCSEGCLILNTDVLGLYIEDEIYLKPYLRPMSSMTEDEKQELLQLLVGKRDAKHFQVNVIGITNTDTDVQVGPNWIYHFMNFSFENVSLCFEYLISRYFDVFNLIPLDIAEKAPEGMYNI